MPVYIVGFDVRNASSTADYSGLQNAVAKLERHRLMPWLYLVSVPFTAGALKEYLLNHMAGDDRLWISRLPARARFEFAYQTMGGTSSWLRKHGRVDLPASSAGRGSVSEDHARSASENPAFRPVGASRTGQHGVVQAANS